jgi:predicted nucleic acid-binding protein
MTRRAIVLDANILIRAVLGRPVRELIMEHVADVRFFAPDTAFDEARQYLPGLLEKRGVGGAAALATLDARWRRRCVPSTPSCTSRWSKQRSRESVNAMPRTWPALACALLLGCPVWTEDADFFGTGVATWTTSRVKLYLSPDEPLGTETSEE